MNVFYKSLIISIIFYYTSANAQSSYYTIWYSADSNHLPQNSVKSIIADKYGYIWISTEDGLVRFDGQNFKTYNVQNVKGLHSNRMVQFGGSVENDSLLMGNEQRDAILINRRTVKTLNQKFHPPEKDIAKYINSPFIISIGLFYSDENEAFGIHTGKTIYIMGNDSIRQYSKSWKLQEHFPYKYPDSSQFFTLAGRLYHDLRDGTYVKFMGSSYKTYSYNKKIAGKYHIYTNAPAQQAFISAGDKLYYLKENNGRVETELLFEDFDCEKYNIVSLYFDERNGVVYLGSSNRGLMMARKKSFSHAASSFMHSSGTDDVYYAMSKWGNGDIITSTGEIFNKEGYKDIINIGKHTDKYMLAVDNNGDIWTKRGKMLFRFTKSSNYSDFSMLKLENGISALSKGPDGKLWLSTFNDKPNHTNKGFLYIIDPADKGINPVLYMKLPIVPAALRTVDGMALWAGSWNGLYRIDIDKKNIKKIKEIPKCHVRSIYAKGDEVWACTYDKGFFLVKNGKTTSFPVDKQGHLLSTHCIVEDNQGFFWITSNKGLFTVKAQDLYNYAAGKIDRIYYHHFTKNGGFLSNEFNGGCEPCGQYINNQTIFFPSMDGVVYFNPADVKKREPSNNIYIDELSIDNKVFPAGDRLEIGHKFDRIRFFINSPHYGNPYNLSIEVKLEGPVTQDWMALTENNASFSTLPPGEYTLKARKLSGFGSKWSYTDYHFTVLPAFWQTAWFIALMGITILILLYYAIRLRLRYIRFKNILLENKVALQTSQLQETIVALRKTRDDLSRQIGSHKKLIKTFTHDIKSPLRFMAITGRYIYNNLEKNKDINKEDIQAIYTSSSQLYHFVDNFLEYTKETDLDSNESEPYVLCVLVDEKISFFRNIARQQKTQLTNTIPGSIKTRVNRHLL
ncbi:MAG TPA: two-component regulator propeller domain-containing protein, partial [Flavobacterium sp.]|nr:two-component regulator propeller domain-containing protein [Flavobacterium sp.]